MALTARALRRSIRTAVAALRRSQPLIRRFCAEKNIRYTETGLADSYRQVIKHLYTVGAAARTPTTNRM
jgi:hypothetical protein